MKFFSNEWAEELKNQINLNQEYRNSSEGWQWPLVLSLKNNATDQFLFLDLIDGECKEVHVPTEEELKEVNFIISANNESWKKILTGLLSPMQALMMKSLTIDKGNMSDLLPYVNSLKVLLNSAMKIESEFE